MRQSLKIAYSLLITVVLFSGFAVLAFTDLFDLVKTEFFQPRVRAEVLSRLDTAASAVGDYHDRNLEYFESFLVSSGAANLIPGGSPGDQSARTFNQAFGDLQVQVAALTSVRIVEAGRNLIHYSSLPTDLRESTATKESYKRLDEADGTVPADRLGVVEGTGPLLIDGPRNRFIYILPVDDNGATALFYVDAMGLSTYLLREAAPVGKGVSTLAEKGVLLDASPAERDAILDGLLAAIGSRSGVQAPFDVPLSVDAPAGGVEAARRVEYQAFALFAPRSGGDWGLVVRLEPRDAFEMSLFLKVLLLASFFVTVFLVTYLLFNLRPDPLEVVSQRVKRFQVQLLESLLERDGTADWGRWRGELERRRGEITQQVQRGIGRVSKQQRPEIDAFIDKGWSEILDLLARRAASAQAPAALDVSRIENLIQQALKSASFVVPAQIIGTTPAQSPRPAAGTPAAARGAPIQVEELRAEDVEDLPEAESVEDIPEASLEESVSDVEPVAEDGPAAPAGAAVEALEVSGAEEVAEAEDVAEAEEVAEAEDVAEAEEIEELEEAGPADDAAAAPGRPAELSIQVSETLQARAPEAPAVDSFMDTLEELEAVTELTPLPPLPEEEGLEMLPTADDGGPRSRPGIEQSSGSAGSRSSGPADAGPPDDFEELEMLEEATESGEEQWSEDDQRQEIERLIASGGIRTWTIEQLQKAAEEARSAIVVENGVFRIKDEVYSAGARGSGRLKRIADEVMGHEPASHAGAEGKGGRGSPAAGAAGEAASELGFSGIVDLMRDAEPLDLFKVVGADRETAAEAAPAEIVRSKTLTMKRNGLDYDEFLAAYPRSFSHTTQMKSLVEVSRRVAAVSAGLLLRKADGWSPDLTVGLGDRTLAGLHFQKGEPFGTLLLGKRFAVAIDRPPGELKTFRVRIDPEDLKYSKRLLLLPATFRGQEAYLLFAFAADSDILLENVLSSLQVQ